MLSNLRATLVLVNQDRNKFDISNEFVPNKTVDQSF
jgi:hypothetical protein